MTQKILDCDTEFCFENVSKILKILFIFYNHFFEIVKKNWNKNQVSFVRKQQKNITGNNRYGKKQIVYLIIYKTIIFFLLVC